MKLLFYIFFTLICLSNINLNFNHYLISDEYDSLIYPEQKHRDQALLISRLLSKYHYKKMAFDDSLSSNILDKYVESLDPNREYFYSSDIKYFNNIRYNIDNYIINGNLEPMYEIFAVYRERAKDRIIYSFEFLESEPDFSIEEDFYFDRKESPWMNSRFEMDDYWRKKIKNYALNLKVLGKEWVDIKEVLDKRYKRFEKTINQFDSEDVFEIFINSYTHLYDPHTDYFSPSNAEKFNINMSKSFEGIGARLVQDVDYTVIYEVIPGGPAFKSKALKKDDKILGVAQGEDEEYDDIVGWRLNDVVKKIKGPKGSIVKLLVLDRDASFDDAPDTIRLVRDKVNVVDEDAEFDIIPIKNHDKLFNFGVITIPSFYMNFDDAQRGVKDYKSVTRDVKRLLDSLSKKNVDGILIDLRNNGGGSLQEAIDLTGLFIDSGPVVQVKSSSGGVDIEKDFDKATHYDGPLFVLNNSFTASSSEIFSGAIQDYNRGLVLGESTFGKGTVQNLIALDRFFRNSDEESFGQLKITLAKYYRISGSSTQKIGVKPDIEFPNSFDREIYTENSRKNALKWDEIERLEYSNKTQISSNNIKELNEIFDDRLKNDNAIKKYLSNIDEIKKNRERKTISLNLQKRLDEKKESDNNDDKLNVSINYSEIFPLENNLLKEKIEKDLYLRESLKLFTDLLNLKS